jgi:hypothetical protein
VNLVDDDPERERLFAPSPAQAADHPANPAATLQILPGRECGEQELTQ